MPRATYTASNFQSDNYIEGDEWTMIKFKQNNAVIALVEMPNWVCVLDNGTYGLCEYDSAEGVSIDGTVYNLPGHSISTNGEISYELVETGSYIMQKNIDTEQMITDLDIANIEAQQAITELELMTLGG